MAEGPEFDSVRVELESAQAPAPPPRSFAPVLVGVIVVLCLVALIVVATRASGNQDSTGEAEGFISSIVPVQLGYFGLGVDHAAADGPDIRRSTDGTVWRRIDTSLGASVEPLELNAWRGFDRLIATSEGFAVLATTERNDEETESLTEVRLERLVSVDGTTWEVDADFDPILSTAPIAVIAHSEEAFMYYRANTANPLLRTLFSQRLRDGVGSNVCYVRTDDDQLSTVSCVEFAQTLVEPADVVDPHRFDELSRCANHLSQIHPGGSYWIVNSTTAPSVIESDNFLSSPTMAPDGTVVVVDGGTPPWQDRTACDGFIDVPEARDAVVLTWDPADPSAMSGVPLSEDVDVGSGMSLVVQPALLGRQLVFVSADSLRLLDIDTGQWGQVVDFVEPVASDAVVEFGQDLSTASFSEDASAVAWIADDRLVVLDVATGAQRFAELESAIDTGSCWFLHVDDETAFCSTGDTLHALSIPDG